MVTNCDEYRKGAQAIRDAERTGTGPIDTRTSSSLISSVAEEGKKKVDSILDPLRTLEAEGERVKATDSVRSSEIGKEITSYGESKTPGSPGQQLNAMLTGDPQVREYMGTLTTPEYSAMREKVANWFGAEFGTKGAMGRNFELTHKQTRMSKIEKELRDEGKFTEAISKEFDVMKGEGMLQRADLIKMDGIETWANFDIDKITTDNIKDIYGKLKKDVGTNIADDVIRQKVVADITKIKETVETTSKKLTKEENKLVTSISDGKTVTIEDFEYVKGITDKLSKGTLDTIISSFKKVNELGQEDKTRIISDRNKWTITGAMKKGGIGTALFLGIGLPGYFYAASFMEQQAFEAAFQFGSFGKEKDSADTLLSKYFGKDAIQKTFLDAHANVMKFYEMMGGIPIYGGYFTAITSAGYASVAAHDGNLADIYNHMVSRGLAVKDSSQLGYRETTEKERSEFYKGNEESLLKNDADWMLKYGKMIYGDDTTIGPDGRPLSSTQMMALYHTYKADGKVSYDAMGKLSLTGRSDNWQTTDQTFVEAVLKYGDEKTKSWKKTTSSTPAETGTGATSETDLMELAVKNAMKRDGVTEIIARKNTEDEVNYLMERDGSTKREALEKLKGKVSGSTTSGTTTTSSSGGETSTQQLPTDEVSKYYQKIPFSSGSYKEKQNIVQANTRNDGTTDIKAIRSVDKDASLPEVAKMASNKQGTVKTFVKENFMQMGTNDKKDLDDASLIDEKATANAIMEAAGKNCTGE